MKYRGKGQCHFRNQKSDLRYNKYKLLEIDSVDAIGTTKDNLKKNDLETLGF